MDVVKITSKTYLSLFKNITYFLKISWAWTLLIVTFLMLPILLNVNFFFCSSFSIFLTSLAYPSIAVAWHKKILDNKYPTSYIYLSFNRTVIAYFLISVAIFILAMVPLIIRAGLNDISATLNIPLIKSSKTTDIFYHILILALPIFVFARLGLVLPAKAINEKNYTFRNSWNMTRDSSFSIILILLITSLPMIAFNEPNQILMNYIKSIGNEFLLSKSETTNLQINLTKTIFISYIVSLIASLLQLSALSYVYKELTEKEENVLTE